MKIFFLLSLLICFFPLLGADQQAFLSIDPIPYFESGYHAHIGVDLHPIRFSIMTSKSDRPLYTEKPATGVKATSKAVGIDMDVVGKTSEGLYGGASFMRVRWLFKHQATQSSIRQDGDLFGGKIGYRHYFRPRFFMDGRVSYYVNSSSNQDVPLAGTRNEISERYIYPFLEFGLAY
ncbi:MAG: hypothetical protein HYV97_09390 [Bdellovibrio sp.]|nr:hypothetical protein [Bdellovibrio sp.]